MIVTPNLLLQSHAHTRAILSKSARLETAALYGAMLLDPRLQSNCLRLEALVHLSVAVGSGTKLVTEKQLASCFNELDGGICGTLEDPAEDVFVSLVSGNCGNFRILEGIWESGAFFLQQFLNIVESMPDEGIFTELRRGTVALLKLSETICDRSGLERFCIGEPTPRSAITKDFCSIRRSQAVVFNREELSRLGIESSDLAMFIFRDMPDFMNVPIEGSPLQQFPIINSDDRIALVLPSAVSFAIRSAIVKILGMYGFIENLRINLTRNYANLLNTSRLLGNFHRPPVFFSHTDGLPISELLASIDVGRFIHFIFVGDNLDNFDEYGLMGVDPTPATVADLFSKRISAARDFAKNKPGYRKGMTLFVYCGIGRADFFAFSPE